MLQNFKSPLSVDEIIDKLISVKEIFLKMLEDNGDFQRWATTKRLTKSSALELQLKQHIEEQGNKEEIISAINRFNKNDTDSSEKLKQILKNDGQLRRLIVDNEQCFISTLKQWKTRGVAAKNSPFASPKSNAKVQRKNQFFDEDPDNYPDLLDNLLKYLPEATANEDEKEDETIFNFFKQNN